MNYSFNQNFTVKTLTDLVRINSINPGLVSGAPGEAEIGAYIADTLRKMNLEPEIHELKSGRKNVTAVLKGSGGGRTLMLNGHMDTVGVEGMKDQFSAEIRDGKLFGRGAQDMKGGLAAILSCVKTIIDSDIRLKGDLIISAVADEEYGSSGTEALVKKIKADAAIVTEPSDLNVCLGHKGFTLFEIETAGREAHGGYPDRGIDANIHMGRVLTELEKLSVNLLNRERHNLLGTPSLHIPLIKGGTELFKYSNKCRISVERRTIPGESLSSLINEIKTIISKLSETDKTFIAKYKKVMHRFPYEISPEAEIVKIVSESAEQVLKKKPAFIGHHWWEDSALIADTGCETVIIGPVGNGLHSHEEWVDIRSVLKLVEILTLSAVKYLTIFADKTTKTGNTKYTTPI